MATIGKTERPKIYTESDQILIELKNELIGLKARMQSIEDEQKQNRNLMNRTSFHEAMANEMLANHQKEIKDNSDNFNVIADFMKCLKSPVSEVVSNLSEVIAEIDDSKTRRTLNECINTASNVLNSFSDIEDFCLNAGSKGLCKRKTADIREFFREKVSAVQSSTEFMNHSFQLSIDESVPQKMSFPLETLDCCLNNLIKEIHNSVPSSRIAIFVNSEKTEKAGFSYDLSYLTVYVKAEKTLDIKWENSWAESIKSNQEKLTNSGFNILKTRDYLRKEGGRLEIIANEQMLQGFRLFIPITDHLESRQSK